MSESLLHPGAAALAPRPFAERRDVAPNALDAAASALLGRLRQRLHPPLARLRRAAARAERQRDAVVALDDRALRAALPAAAAAALRDDGAATLGEALALVREAARRSLGIEPFATQLMGAAGLLAGRLVEMQTGEGKTLTAGLAACIAAAAGVPVHVVTVNDYLAQRDADEMQPLLGYFGLRCGVIKHGLAPPEKQQAYAAQVTYCTNKELVFDYLRDRVTAQGPVTKVQLRVRALAGGGDSRLLQRGLHFAIVDEADSVLIDEARTPLILAERDGPVQDAGVYPEALALADQMAAGEHFIVEPARRELRLTASGQRLLAAWAVERTGDGTDGAAVWRSVRGREHLATQALRARHLFLRDQHYLVADGKVQIVDEYTGRVLPGRTWEQGLHQMIEAKEGCELSEDNRTLARITYQRYFCRYLRLSGMTGTAREVAAELRATYRLDTVTVPTHRPSQRRNEGVVVCRDEAAKWQAVAAAVAAQVRRGRPVLVGTRSVEASERLSAVLGEHGIAHRILNARQDADEAEVVAAAGQPGAVTVATNMAGRGTDIRLAPGVAAQGGLLVVLTEFHDSPRIDRQLYGRCARQGDPGGTMTIVAADDALLKEAAGVAPLLATLQPWRDRSAGRAVLHACRRLAQAGAERRHAATRRQTLKHDRNLDTQLAFAGSPL